MINETEIVFVTTTLYTKWLSYQSKIIKEFFPESKHLIIDGRKNWPNSWFYWINEVKKTNCKYFIHIDEDFFLTSKDEFIKVIEKMELEDIDLMGPSDGYNHYRGYNPVAMNTYILFGRVDKIKLLNIDNIQFMYTDKGWLNNLNLVYKEEYGKDFVYKFIKHGGCNYNFQQEPYYAFMWAMKDIGCKFDYLYSYFNDYFKSSNPRITEKSNDIGIHMWYTRQWNSNMDVWGLPNIERYNRLEKFITENK